MPSSAIELLTPIMNEVIGLNPKSILDIGIGFGKYGFLCREYLDIRLATKEPNRYSKWEIRIDGIEIFTKYITEIQKLIYSNIYFGNALQVIDTLPDYDLILMIDVIEHLEKGTGKFLVAKARKKCSALIISVPNKLRKQEAVMGNVYEKHISTWAEADFKGAEIRKMKRQFLCIY